MSENKAALTGSTIIEATNRFPRPSSSSSFDLELLLEGIREIQESGMEVNSSRSAPERAKSKGPVDILQLLNDAAHAVTAVEERSQAILSKASELICCARSERQEAGQRIAALQQQLAVSEAEAARLAGRLSESEAWAQEAHQLLCRFNNTLAIALSARTWPTKENGKPAQACA
jgi:hypothetical protein